VPLYRTGLDMWKKYQAKFNPGVVGTRFTDVRDLALDRAQEGLNVTGSVRDLIRPILDDYGIHGGQRATYLAFGTAIMRHALRVKGDAAAKVSTGLKSYFVNAYGLDPAVCDEIIQVVTGWAIAY